MLYNVTLNKKSKTFWIPERSGPCKASTTLHQSFVEELESNQALSLLIFALGVEKVITPRVSGALGDPRLERTKPVLGSAGRPGSSKSFSRPHLPWGLLAAGPALALFLPVTWGRTSVGGRQAKKRLSASAKIQMYPNPKPGSLLRRPHDPG